MTTIWRRTGFVENDPWVFETEERSAGEGERALTPFAELVENGLTGNNTAGVVLEPFDDPMKLAPFLERIEIVALTFPAFGDGRAFSQATLLREQLGYAGELRAIGDVLIDPLVHMLRCGFDSFAVENDATIRILTKGTMPAVTNYYQPAAQRSDRVGGYSWRRIAKI